ncbi:MAG: cellulase family glycosylhydrolase [Anaerolineae bacterium]|nr:cellulase family glycosylhydrolase [Anaerolineae bacterium]
MRPSVFIIALLLLIACTPAVTPTSSLPDCTGDTSQALAAYSPSTRNTFVTLREGRFAVDDQPLNVRGVNYYPARSPWRRFLTQSDLSEVERELTLLRVAEFNTLRLFLWNAALFQCPPAGVTPKVDAFTRLDTIIQAAASQGFYLIMTLNDLPDLDVFPLYTNPVHVQAQTRFIVERYQAEPAILAWDLRNEGDIDYGSIASFGQGRFNRDVVLNWLRDNSALVRSLDSNHLITAGWLHYSHDTAPYVDFISFHHWEDAERLRQRTAEIRSQTEKPILLQEFGYSTFQRTPEEQARLIREVVEASEALNLTGWLIWAAFDFPLDATCIPPACPSADNAEHHFGIWQSDYTPKPIVEWLLNR